MLEIIIQLPKGMQSNLKPLLATFIVEQTLASNSKITLNHLDYEDEGSIKIRCHAEQYAHSTVNTDTLTALAKQLLHNPSIEKERRIIGACTELGIAKESVVTCARIVSFFQEKVNQFANDEELQIPRSLV